MRMNMDLSNQKPETTNNESLLPSGDYLVAFCGAALIDTKSGGKGLKLSMKVVSGEQEGKEIGDFLNIINQNPDAQRISLSRLRKICDLTTGKTTLTDTDEIMGKQVMVHNEQEQRGEYWYNKIKSYSPATQPTPASTIDSQMKQTASKKNPWE